MTTNARPPELEEIRKDVEAGKERKVSVRELLRWFGVRRRRERAVERIETELMLADLRTEPHFTTIWIDLPVTFHKRAEAKIAADQNQSISNNNKEYTSIDETEDRLNDSKHLVRMLEAANRHVVRVSPNDPISKAITLMLSHDFSQLGVMTNDRELKGAISWKSLGSRLSQGKQPKAVFEAMEPAFEVSDTASIFETTKRIIETDYVFVRSADRTITGIVTATDLSAQFRQLSEPFLLLGRIENQIRQILKNFDVEKLRSACHESDPDRKSRVNDASDLTFGEYLRLLENEENWNDLPFTACRSTFCKELNEVRSLRNEIMHFHPDALDDEDFEPLHRFSRLLEKLDGLSR